MIYIFETEIITKKPVIFALKKIYGIGSTQAVKICKILGFSQNFKTSSLTNDQIKKLIKTIDLLGLVISSNLKKKKTFSLKRLVNLKTYRGIRGVQGLPVRGQRTHTNGKTSKVVRFKY